MDEIVDILFQVAAEKPHIDSRPDPGLSIPTPVWYIGKGHYPPDAKNAKKTVALIHVLPAFLRKIFL